MAGEDSNSFTQADRELLVRLDERLNQIDKRFEQIDKRFEMVDKRIEELREDMNKRFEQSDKRMEELREDMNKRFEQLMNFLWMLSAIFTSLVLAVITFALWDRRTMLKHARDEMEKEGRLSDLIRAMRKVAEKNSDVAAALKSVNLL